MSRKEGGVAVEARSGGVWEIRRLLGSLGESLGETMRNGPASTDETAEDSLKDGHKDPADGGSEAPAQWVSRESCEALLQERDDMWRRHEAFEVSRLQENQEKLVKGLHDEIHRLQDRISQLTHFLALKFDSVCPQRGEVEEAAPTEAAEVKEEAKERKTGEEEAVGSLEAEYEGRLGEAKARVRVLEREVERKAGLIASLSQGLRREEVHSAVARRSNSMEMSPLRSVSVSVSGGPLASRHFLAAAPLRPSLSIDSPARPAAALPTATAPPPPRRFSAHLPPTKEDAENPPQP